MVGPDARPGHHQRHRQGGLVQDALAVDAVRARHLAVVAGVDNQRIPAVEVLLNTPYISDLIEKGKVDEIKDAMTRGNEQGMQTFDQSLLNLYREGKITKENAIKYADSKNNVGLQIRLNEDKDFNSDDLTIQSDENEHF